MTGPAPTPAGGAQVGDNAPNLTSPDGVGILLGLAHRARRRAWEARLSDLDLTAPQAALLRLVAAEPGYGVRNLACQLGTDPMNVQRISETLVTAGLCETRRDPLDGRRRPLHPTDEGCRRAAIVTQRGVEAERELARSLGGERYRTLLTELRALAAASSEPLRTRS